jgi:hypothetical protein
MREKSHANGCREGSLLLDDITPVRFLESIPEGRKQRHFAYSIKYGQWLIFVAVSQALHEKRLQYAKMRSGSK